MQTEIIAEPGKQEIFLIREFDAPRELVFRAFVDAELYVQWIGPRELNTTLEIFEPEHSGRWRYTQKNKDGNEYSFRGVNHEVIAPELIISTFEFEIPGEIGHVALETVRFESLPDNRTKVIDQSVFQSVADRDAVIESGIERGVNDSHNRLDDLLVKELLKINISRGFKNILSRFWKI